MEALTGEKTPGQIARQYGNHPNSVGLWMKQFLGRGAEIFTEDDHVSKLVLGWTVGERPATQLVLAAWDRASHSMRSHGVRLQRVMLPHDKDSVFTGHGWTARLLLMDRVRVSYALNSARDSPEMEVFNSRFETTNQSHGSPPMH